MSLKFNKNSNQARHTILIEAGMDVDIEVVDGKLTLLPAVKEYNLNHLLAEITCDNTHAAVDVDGAVGKEAW